jgi:hypothetical protein
MTTIIADMMAFINNLLAPIVPAGVTGVQFISVFLLVYAIIFLLTSQIHILKDNRMAAVMFALVIAFFTASSAFSVLLITKLFPNVGMITMIMIGFLAVIAIIPKEEGVGKLTFGPLLTLAGIALVAYFTWTSMAGTISLEGLNLPELSKTEIYGIVFLLLLFGFILLIYLSGKKPRERQISKHFLRDLSKFLFGYEK